MQNSEEVVGATPAKGVTTDHQVHSTKVFVTHTFGKFSYQQPSRNFCIVPIRNILQAVYLQ